MLAVMPQPMLHKDYTMKLLISTLLLTGAMCAPSFAGYLVGGAPIDPDKASRPGGYYEAVASKKSMVSVQGDPCPSGTVYSAGECICVH